MSSIVHHEDGGSVYSSIRDDGAVLHWCDKCRKAWLSQEKPQEALTHAEKQVVNTSTPVLMKFYYQRVQEAARGKITATE